MSNRFGFGLCCKLLLLLGCVRYGVFVVVRVSVRVLVGVQVGVGYLVIVSILVGVRVGDWFGV